MSSLVLRAPGDFETAFAGIRAELDVPLAFPAEVLEEADRAAPESSVERVDVRHLPLIAIDPPGATDLDQAFTAQRIEGGYRVFYAIADVGAFVTPGGAVDAEARRRGITLYSPDSRASLHPPILSEDRASLLPGQDKPALLWTIDLDEEGRATSWNLIRAVVRVAEAIPYRAAQERIDRAISQHGSADEHLVLLSVIGRLRQQREAERGGVSLDLPAQEIVKRHDGYVLTFDRNLPVEGWNAQISLLTGMVAGRTMTDAGVGILRTLPPADPADVDVLRRIADVLDLGWPADTDYAGFVRTLQPTTAAHNAFLVQCTRLFKGAGYHGLAKERPDNIQHSALETRALETRALEHSAIASLYAHVTAPLRRLVDRFGNEILLSVLADREPPQWAVEALDELPSLMGKARQRESALERAMLDMTEVLTLENHIGDIYDSVVVNVSESRNQATVQITEPAVVTRLPVGSFELAERVKLRLTATDREQRTVTFEPVSSR